MRPLFVPTTTLYKDSVNPVETDGRDIDGNLGQLVGEAATQRSGGRRDEHLNLQNLTAPSAGSGESGVTYYDRPLLQLPVWEWVIPAYYYVGGITGASLVLSAAAQLRDGRSYDKLIFKCHLVALGGAALSSVFLIYDLGRPERFFNMLRVFRPTSAMNVGAWILSGVGATAPLALVLRNREGFLGALGKLFTYAAGLFGAGLATYTGVLVSSTAVPVWQQSRKTMPILFASSAMASAGSLFDILPSSKDELAVTGSFKSMGQLAELGASYLMEHEASTVERVGRPFHKGASGAMWKTAAVLTAASIVLDALPGRSRVKRFSAGLLGSFGSLLLRFSVDHMGKASALDARASFQQQRAGQGAAEATGW